MPAFGPDQERHLVSAGRAGLPLPQLDDELALSHADAPQLERHSGRKRICSLVARHLQRSRYGVVPLARCLCLGRRSLDRVEPARERVELGTSLIPACQQLLVALAVEPAPRSRDLVEPGLDRLHPLRIRLQRRSETVQVAADVL